MDDGASGTDPTAASASAPARRNGGRTVAETDEILNLLAEPIDADEDDEGYLAAQQAAFFRKSANIKGRSVKKGGGFQAMGLNLNLLKAITRKGYAVPTPIQRKTIPLVLDGQDVVGMARTGSGKTAAFVIPMIQKLKAHSARVGARAIVLSPSRELALQTLKVVKELARGADLRCILLVGGDSLEDQFAALASNPDIIIATPGRFLHLQVEMSLDLSSVRYAVFDEADRLFEMGFAAQLAEILHALPASRQTLLFSATLPKSLVEFARAGLQEPNLVRLDAESKISPDLQSAFFTVKSSEKEGALLHVIGHIINIPTGPPVLAVSETTPRKRKRAPEGANPTDTPTEFSTVVFTATKHHVEYVAALLRVAGFAVSYAYGSLDQTARRMQVQNFRSGLTHVLVVTDVAARGIDIPILANVVNYDFPAQPKIFVHRVGRTARAGQQGWSYSLVTEADAPYLLDLQLFLGRRLVCGDQSDGDERASFAQDVVVGGFPRDALERGCEEAFKFLQDESDLAVLRSVAGKGEKLYIRTRNAASSESAKRSKTVVTGRGWEGLHPLFADASDRRERARRDMVARVSGFRPHETVFEIGNRGRGEAAEIMRRRRQKITPRGPPSGRAQSRAQDSAGTMSFADTLDKASHLDDLSANGADGESDSASEELEVTASQANARAGGASDAAWTDSEHFMSYVPTSTNLAEDRGYGVHSGATHRASDGGNFVQAAQGVSMDLTNDEGSKSFAEPSRARGMRWDKKQKKFVARANDEDGSKGAKFIKGESGQKIAASFRSGRFDAWRRLNKIDRMPRTGEAETTSTLAKPVRFKHRQQKAPKEADKFRDDYHKRKKRVEEAKEQGGAKSRHGGVKSEIRSVDDVRKQRTMKTQRREKNARPSKRRKG
ncbi:MAG: ATP-dependent RNA helicase dbp10 [Thelocarpon superellum]|nr:MAG: ATP-dependent RNA helicase dbp10 [Thelocarpon superellum]